MREALAGRADDFHLRRPRRRHRFGRGAGGRANGARSRRARRRFCHLAILFRRQTPHWRRRRKRSRELHEIADAVICFENDRMGDMVAPKAGIHQAFAVADTTISQSVRSIVNLIQRPGLIRIGFDDLLSALRRPNGRCLFGFGESDSDNRAHDALTQALKNPLMDRGRMLADAAHVLVQIAGGPGMTLSEVEILMQELGRHVGDHTQILFGTSVDGRMGNRLSVTLISSLAPDGRCGGAAERKSLQRPRPVEPPPPPPETEPPIWEQQQEEGAGC